MITCFPMSYVAMGIFINNNKEKNHCLILLSVIPI